jgi:type I restriction enzyme M protein
LFIDYINEHLKPNGRAGIIVPEGIIFQTGTAYKQLRKRLIETSLTGVISLPAGVFQPYSGVKTSILILDKKKNKSAENIYFIKVENDGYSLNSNRNKIEGGQLEFVISEFLNNFKNKNKNIKSLTKKNLLDDENYSLLPSSYEDYSFTSKKYSSFKLKDICNIKTGKKDVNEGNPQGIYPFFTCAKNNTFSDKFSFDCEALLIVGNGRWTGKVNYYKGKFEAYQRTYVLSDFKELNCKYLYYILNYKMPEYLDKLKVGNAIPFIKLPMLQDFKLPLPTLETQNQIVEELAGYQKIIDGCRQVIENYKPSIDIDPSWEMVELEKISNKITDGTHKTPEYTVDGVPFLRVTDITKSDGSKKFISKEEHKELIKRCNPEKGDILYSKNGTIGISQIVDWDYEFSIFVSLCLIKPNKEKVLPEYLGEILNTTFVFNQAKNLTKTGTVSNLHLIEIKN